MKFNIWFRFSSPVTSIGGAETECTSNPVEADSITDLMKQISENPPDIQVGRIELVGCRIERVE